jgi:hypothetical protein
MPITIAAGSIILWAEDRIDPEDPMDHAPIHCVSPHTLIPPQLAKHLNFAPTAAQSASTVHDFVHALSGVEHIPASENVPKPRHERPAAQSPLIEHFVPAGWSAPLLHAAATRPSMNTKTAVRAFPRGIGMRERPARPMPNACGRSIMRVRTDDNSRRAD